MISQHLTVNDGFLTNSVSHMLQDKEGLMWFGSDDGLFCYDGLQLKNRWNTLQTNVNVLNLVEDEYDRIWMRTSSGIYIYDKVRMESRRFSAVSAEGDSIGNSVTVLEIDPWGDIWMGTSPSGLYRYDIRQDSLYTVIPQQSDFNISEIYFDHEQQMWLVANIVHVYKADFCRAGQQLGQKDFKEVSFTDAESASIPTIYQIFQDSNRKYWVGANTGIYRLAPSDSCRYVYDLKISRPVSVDKKNHPVFISGITENDNNIYASTNHGLLAYSEAEQSATWYVPDFSERGTLNDHTLSDIFVDGEGGLWIATAYGGVNYQSPNIGTFSSHVNINNKLGGHVVSGIMEDADGNIWLSVEDGGYCFWDRKTNEVTHFTRDSHHPLRPTSDTVLGIFVNEGKVYLGTWGAGLDVFDFLHGKSFSYHKGNSGPDPLPNAIYTFKQTRNGHLLLGTHKGVYDFETSTGQTAYMESGIQGPVNSICQDQFHNLWVGTATEGLYRYSASHKTWEEIKLVSEHDSTAVSNVVSVSTLGSYVYVGTYGHGLWSYDLNTRQLTPIVPKALGETIVFCILPEKDVLWITTNQGLYSYNVINQRIRQFTEIDGIRSNQFKRNSGCITSDGYIIVGGVNGINYFKSSEIRGSEFKPEAILTNFYISNQLVDIHSPESPLKQSVTYAQEIELNEKYNSVAFEFSSSSYSHTNKYEYQLEPLDWQWKKTQNNMATYTFLPPGDYVFNVRTSNGEGIWSDTKSIRLTIHPYWWHSLPMKMVYLFVFIGLMVAFILRYHRKKKKEMQLFRFEKEQEVYQSKMEFFTSMVHEIRTPLTLISGPLSNILRRKGSLEEVQPDLRMMERNCQRLLNLVNQLMDFRKVEEKSYTVLLERNDIKLLTETIIRDFQLYNTSKSVSFTCALPSQHCWAIVDKEAFNKVLTNLLSNAMKFTKDKIEVSLSLSSDKNSWLLAVRDNGRGISPEDQQAIFGSFYQVRKDLPYDYVGTGIGLAVVKRLTSLMHGKISVESKIGEGACFTLQLPCDTSSVAEAEASPEPIACEVSDALSVDEKKESEPQRLLVVEDNLDMRTYISHIFSSQFEVSCCENGREALQMVGNTEFDLIITDLMMPVMDGIALCKSLKAGENTSHIPVVLLTAKADEQSQKEGYEAEADLYVVKPFSQEVLRSQVKSLLRNRERLHKRFYTEPEVLPEILCQNETDSQFLNKFNELIEERIENSNIPIDDIARELGMVRCVFYKKMKIITGLTPNEYIRTIRFKKAIALFRHGEKSIKEVCYMVGFSSHSYFTKRFTDQFGVSPSDYIGNVVKNRK